MLNIVQRCYHSSSKNITQYRDLYKYDTNLGFSVATPFDPITNFKSFKTEVSFPIEFSLLAGVNYVEDRDKGKISHGYVKQLELNLVNNGYRSLKRELYESMAKIGLGRDLMVYSKKVVDQI